MKVGCLHILSQGTGLRVEYQYTAGIGAYPQLTAPEAQGMCVLARQDIAVRIVDEALLSWRVAHQSTVIAGNPYMALPVLTET